jgi:hypothetical protein
MCTRRTKVSYVIIGMLVSLCVVACKSGPSSPYREEEKNFNSYLSSTFGRTIGADSTNYILMSDNGCRSCINETADVFSKYQKSLFIVSPRTYNDFVARLGIPRTHCLIDSSARINRLRYSNGSIGIVQAAHNRIYNIAYVEAYSMGELLPKLVK